jgi:hypothetical protein
MSTVKSRGTGPNVRGMTDADLAEFQRRFEYDEGTGELLNKVPTSGAARVGGPAGCICRKGGESYVQIMVNNVRWQARRVVAALVSGKPIPGDVYVDIIDGDSLNTRWSNLRLRKRKPKGKKAVHNAREMTQELVEEFKRRFEYSPDDGILRNRLNTPGGGRKGSEAGGGIKNSSQPKRVKVFGITWLTSRVIYAMMTDAPTPKDKVINHIDGYTFNERWDNLILSTGTRTPVPGRVPANNTSGTVGVGWDKRLQRWVATIRRDGKISRLGYFTLKDDAIKARRKAELAYYKELRASAKAQK